MKRKMVYVGISYVSGLFFASYLNFNAVIILALSLAFAMYLTLKNKCYKELTVCAASFVIGFAVYFSYVYFTYNPIISYNGSEVEFCGKVTEVTEYSGDKSAYVLKGSINSERDNVKLILYTETLDCEYGDEIFFKGKVSVFENKYEFPAYNYYKGKNIFLQADKPESVEIRKSNFSLIKYVLRYREYISQKIEGYLPGEEGDALAAMLFGVKTGLSSKAKDLMFRSGIGHVMSASGLHLVVASALVMGILKIFTKRRYVLFAALEITSFMFSMCAGFCVPVIRAWIMITFVYSARLFFRTADSLNSLCISMIILTVFSPFSISDSSLLLSAAGVFGLGVFAPYITEKIKSKLLKTILSMICVTIAVFPISVMFFDEASLISPLSNMILIPICDIALICGLLVAFTGGIGFLAEPLMLAAGICCKLVLSASEFVGSLKYSYIPLGFGFLRYLAFALFLFVICIYFLYKSRKAVFNAVLCSFIVILVSTAVYNTAEKDTTNLVFFGSGKNCAAVVYDSNTAIVIDSGKGDSSPEQVKKLLSRVGISRLDALIITGKPNSTVSSYASKLELVRADSILVSENAAVLDDCSVLGGEIQPLDLYSAVSTVGNFEIKFISEDTFYIKNSDFYFCCFNGEMPFEQPCTVAVELDKDTQISCDCSYMVVSDESINDYSEDNLFYMDNFMVKSAPDGNIKINKLDE